MRRKIVISIFILIAMILISSCGHYKELEDMVIAAGMAIDKNTETGDYILTIEVFDQQGTGEKSNGQNGEKTSKAYIIETEGYTIIDAMRNAIYKSGKKVFFGHCKGIIISEDLAREGIIPIIDFIWRDHEPRPDIWMMVSRDNYAGEILKTKMESGDIISVYIDSFISEVDSISKFIPSELVKFISELTVKTTSVVTPTVFTEVKEDKSIPMVKGSAVFKKDKLIYFLDEDESRTALLLRNKLKGGIWTLDRKDAQGENIRIAFEVFGSNVDIKPEIVNGNIEMKITVEMEASIAEIQGSENFIKRDKRKILEKELQDQLVGEIKDLVKKTQDNQATDIFGFDGIVKRKMPDYWKKNEDKWDNIYKKIKINPTVDVKLSLSASTIEPIKIED